MEAEADTAQAAERGLRQAPSNDFAVDLRGQLAAARPRGASRAGWQSGAYRDRSNRGLGGSTFVNRRPALRDQLRLSFQMITAKRHWPSRSRRSKSQYFPSTS